ncbi:LuxR C-terminal-related transcriptional regulator [Aestuariibacter halophilus]|uniref:LuxR C-terminal-related transcriptional regulator n=1 Tax=Fluctibacter halophilus TaxID=226011 RepID=A0ABS8G4U5_9ALTE|nr:LuxR C-terminal-related transcriptional regulator [Aestuariibacter halophilus]MCC2614679.1 LuxR C-terminal-related transcriptional regulator [Aestuariibacter halophilus]
MPSPTEPTLSPVPRSQITLILRYGLALSLALLLVLAIELSWWHRAMATPDYLWLMGVGGLIAGVYAGWQWRKQRVATPQLPALTHRERQLLEDLSQGLTNQQLADKHCISVNTVKSHLKTLYKKLSVGKRHEAVAVWQRHNHP